MQIKTIRKSITKSREDATVQQLQYQTFVISTGDNKKSRTVHATTYAKSTFRITVATNYAIAIATLSGWLMRIWWQLFNQ